MNSGRMGNYPCHQWGILIVVDGMFPVYLFDAVRWIFVLVFFEREAGDLN
jgi:hypothetical protein